MTQPPPKPVGRCHQSDNGRLCAPPFIRSLIALSVPYVCHWSLQGQSLCNRVLCFKVRALRVPPPSNQQVHTIHHPDLNPCCALLFCCDYQVVYLFMSVLAASAMAIREIIQLVYTLSKWARM